MNWMTRWPGDYPVFVERPTARASPTSTATGTWTSASATRAGWPATRPKVAVDAIAEQAAKGITLMLPTEDAAWVGREMARRFGLPYWQFCLTATDANRFAIRLGAADHRPAKIVVHNWCYHGSVDESFATLDADGEVAEREGNVGEPVTVASTTRVVEFNDLDGLEARARPRRRRGLPVRAGAHEHRHRAAGPGLPRGRARACTRTAPCC